MQFVLLYLAAIVAANLSIAYFGPASAPVNGFLLIGLDLSLRDRLHDRWRNHLWPRMGALIAAAGFVSWLLNPAAGRIALASVIAFAVASASDAIVYQFLRKRSWNVRANGSNLAGAAVDSLLFPWIAFGGFNAPIVLAMFAAKVAGGAVWALILRAPEPAPQVSGRSGSS